MELKNQYIIGYRPTNETKDGKWRKIHVKVIYPKGTPQLSVRARSGHYAPSSETSQ
jgi:Ca-activated chloride channel family protein